MCLICMKYRILYFTLLYSNSSAIGVELVYDRTILLDPVVYICHRDSHLIVQSGTSSSQRFRGLPLDRRPSDWTTSVLLWGAVVVILLMCDHHLILFLLAVCSAGCMFTRRLISSLLILSILVFPAAFLRHLITVFVNICLSLLVRFQFSLW